MIRIPSLWRRIPRAVIAAIIVCLILAAFYWDSLAMHTPVWISKFVALYWVPRTHRDAPLPIVVPALLTAPWMGTFPAPALQPPSTLHLASEVPALLLLHIFSMPTESARKRRDLIRKYHPMRTVPQGYRHLVEVKFVMGQPRDDDTWDWMSSYDLQLEQEEHGDLMQLDMLRDGENMNEGKSLDWLQWVGRHGRKAQWVWKCDDDTFVILPNLLAELLNHDPSVPTYIGTSLGRGRQFHLHFLGMAYGFSWPVVQTIAQADIPRKFIEESANEDARMGEIMFSLPSKPSEPDLVSRYPCLRTDSCTDEERTDVIAPDIYWWTRTWRRDYPRAPDPRTDLHYVNLLNKLVQLKPWPKILGLGTRNVIAWHGVKSDEDYIAAYHEAESGFRSRRRPYEWRVPTEMVHLREPSV